jgi:uncharacterized protein
MEGVHFLVNSVQRDVDQPLDCVVNTIVLLEGGATIPFIARYRKERTGNMDEVMIRKIAERVEYYREMEARKAAIIKSIESQKKMTAELKKKILECVDKNVLEDIYLPYKPKYKTRATTARDKGLGPLANILATQETGGPTKEELAAPFINAEKGVKDYKEAVAGAKDIIAERVADSAGIRGWIRNYTAAKGLIQSVPRPNFKEVKTKYSTYYDISELIKNSPSHRLLAIRRGTKEEVLSWKIVVDNDYVIDTIQRSVVKNPKLLFKDELKDAVADAYTRLMATSIQVEIFMANIARAEEEAISVFSKNLQNLLLAPPAGSKITIGVDPGYRTGCKIAVVDEKGDFKEFQTIYPTPPENDMVGSEAVLMDLVLEYEPELFAVGNGTASKEIYSFIKGMLKKHNKKINVVMVSEAGASVYSASELAGAEYPDLDVTARGAISIAHRLQDPLAELIKIDPKAIGVGQYQHDVNQKELKKSLDLTVDSCVNFVGVDLNTASQELLSHVSGIGPAAAENIVKYRSDNGKFTSREELKKVPKFTAKAFEQSAGFLKIRGALNPLDYSTIHPEAYPVVEKMASDAKVTVKDIIANAALLDKINLDQYATAEIGILTLRDVIKELKKPGLDPRTTFQNVEFSEEINELEDLTEGMVLKGTATNVTNFGVFVDIGVHQDGLIHISEIADTFIKNPYEVLSVGDTLTVEVLEVDTELKRIALRRISGGKAPDVKPGQGPKANNRGPAVKKDEPTTGFKIGSMFE